MKKIKIDKKIEEQIARYYSKEVAPSPYFEKKLANMIDTKINLIKDNKNKSGFLNFLFGLKWNVVFLTTLIALFFAGGIAYALSPISKPDQISKGKLKIQSNPENAEVFIEGGDFQKLYNLGKTPLEVELKTAVYSIKIIADDYNIFSDTIFVQKGTTKLINAVLAKKSPLEKFTEWIVYKDVDFTIETQYPSSWQFEKNENSLIFSDSNNKFSVLKICNTLGESEEIGDGIFKLKKALSFTQTYYKKYENVCLIFSTNDENNLLVFKEIISRTTFFTPSTPAPEMQVFTDEENLFSFKLSKESFVTPSSIENARKSYKIFNNGNEIMQILVFDKYPKEINNYIFREKVIIGGIEAKKYCVDNCLSTELLELTNNIYIKILTEPHDIEVDTILQNFSILGKESYTTIIDNETELVFNFKNNWKFAKKLDTSVQPVTFVDISNDNTHIKVAKWEKSEIFWNKFASVLTKDQYSTEQNLFYVDGKKICLTKINKNKDNQSPIFFLSNNCSDVFNAKTSIGQEDFLIFITFDSSVINQDNFEEAKKIVSSFTKILK